VSGAERVTLTATLQRAIVPYSYLAAVSSCKLELVSIRHSVSVKLETFVLDNTGIHSQEANFTVVFSDIVSSLCC
jgi:hypothetical protein